MIDRLEGECDTQTPGQTTHGRPSDESSAKSWKDSESIGKDSSGLAGSGPKEKKIAQGYKTQGLKGMGNSWLRGSGPKKKDSSGLAGSGLKGEGMLKAIRLGV